MALLPSDASLTGASTTTAQQKSNFSALRSFLADLLGTDSSDKAAARAALGSNSAANLTTGTLPAARLPAATDAAVGGVELATTAEAKTGTDTTRAVTAAGLAARTGVLSFRNKLINATFQVNQRGYVSGAATSGANQYTLDRWRVVTSGQNIGWSGTAPNLTATAPAGGMEQVIEGAYVEGGVYTLSWTGTATATVNGSAITNGGQTASLTAGANVTVRFTGGTVSKPQFELGSSSTSFELRSVGLELVLCQRYYEIGQVSIGASGSSSVGVWVPFSQAKRATPTVTRPGDTGLSGSEAGSSFTNVSTTGFYAGNTASAAGGTFTAAAEL